MTGSLTATQVNAYQETGYLFPVPGIEPARALTLCNHINAFETETGLVAGQVIRNKGHLKLRAFYDLTFEPTILDAVESVLGPDLLCWGASLFVKEAQGSGNMLFTHEEIAVAVDESQAVALVLERGEMSLHHVKIVHGSKPNRSNGRRLGLAIRYVAPQVRQNGPRASATLVRGQDNYGHFAPDPIPTQDMQPEIVAFVDAPLGAEPAAKA